MVRKLADYEAVIGKDGVERIRKEAAPLIGKHVVHVNSAYYGGGVAELLNAIVLLTNDLGIKCGWRLFKGSPEFFSTTKKIHNALQGERTQLTAEEKSCYFELSEFNARFTHIEPHDLVIIHDPQPLPLINQFKKHQPWAWRCHIDLSDPEPSVWEVLRPMVEKYDQMIVSKEEYKRDIKVPQRIIYPSIDPLSEKNRPLSDKEIDEQFAQHNIPRDKPIISQVSRFDKWKDPVGVIRTFRMVREYVDCRLILLGNFAADDPEGQEVYDQMIDMTRGDPDVHVINFSSDILVNAVQTASDVVLQKSLREGFALTVSEALWKETPVIGGNVGGIPLQIVHGETGYLVDSIPAAAQAVVYLLRNPEEAKRMGAAGKKRVQEHFLITRHLLDYVHLMNDLLVPQESQPVAQVPEGQAQQSD